MFFSDGQYSSLTLPAAAAQHTVAHKVIANLNVLGPLVQDGVLGEANGALVVLEDGERGVSLVCGTS